MSIVHPSDNNPHQEVALFAKIFKGLKSRKLGWTKMSEANFANFQEIVFQGNPESVSS